MQLLSSYCWMQLFCLFLVQLGKVLHRIFGLFQMFFTKLRNPDGTDSPSWHKGIGPIKRVKIIGGWFYKLPHKVSNNKGGHLTPCYNLPVHQLLYHANIILIHGWENNCSRRFIFAAQWALPLWLTANAYGCTCVYWVLLDNPTAVGGYPLHFYGLAKRLTIFSI